jgi:ATP-binding cassette subfamily B protein
VEAAEYSSVWIFFIFLILLKFSELIMKPLSFWVSDQVGGRASVDLRETVFSHIHNLDYAFHASKSSGSLISIFKRGENAFIMFHSQLNIFTLKILIDFTFILIFSLTLYPKIAIIIFIVFVCNAIAMYFTIKSNIRARGDLNDAEDRLSAQIIDNMISFETIKYFAREDFEISRFKKSLNKWFDKFINYVKTFRYIDIINGSILAIGFIITIGITLYDLTNGNISLGDFVLVLSFISILFPNLQSLIFQIRDIAKNYEDLYKYISVLDEETIIKESRDPLEIENLSIDKGIEIKFDDVTFYYEDNDKVLDNISFKINKGEKVAFVGRSGAGKSTIIKLLLRFFDPTKGTISMNNFDINAISKKELRNLISVVPQDSSLFNNTLRYNITYPKDDISDKQIDNILRKSYLKSFVSSLRNGLETYVGERGLKLSGGQKQRVAIARAFLEDAPILVFDEATSNLDSESEKVIQESLWKLAKDKTTIVIAHRLATIQKVDRIFVVDEGEIVESGDHKELMNKGGIYSKLSELQDLGEIN